MTKTVKNINGYDITTHENATGYFVIIPDGTPQGEFHSFDTLKAAVDFLKAATPKKELTERQTLNRLHKIADAELRKKEAEKEIEAIRAEIIGEAENLSIDNELYKISYTAVTSSRIDTKRLKEEKPKIYADYLKESCSMRFTYTIR